MNIENKYTELFTPQDYVFTYKGYRFKPAVFRLRGDFDSIMRNCDGFLLSRDRDGYSWTDFYKTVGCDYDLFKCLDTNWLYLPCENYLFRYFWKEVKLCK